MDSNLRVADWNYGRTGTGNTIVRLEWQKDTVQTGIDTSYCKDCRMNLQYVSVPLSLSYEYPIGKVRVFTGIGVSYNFLLKASGFYSAQNEVIGLDNSSIIKQSYLNANIDLGIRGDLFYGLGYFASYRYGLGINSMTGPYTQKANSNQLRLGISVRL